MKNQATNNLIFLPLFFLMFLTQGYSETLQLNPIKDNTLYETDFADTSNGIGEYTFIGRTGNNAGALLRRAMAKFDVSDIPANSTINAVSVSFTVSKVPPGASAASASIHLLLSDWGEGTSLATGAQGEGIAAQPNDATWKHAFFDTQFWTNPGGDYTPTTSATANYGVSNGEIIEFLSTNGLIADVQLWVNSPLNNFGWIILGDEVTIQNSRRFNTREHTTGVPVLSIDYTLPPDNIFANGFE